MHAKQYLLEVSAIANLIDPYQIERMVGELVALRARRGRLFVCGLGGSAANASHFVNDLRKLCGIEAYSMTENVAELTARMNDENVTSIFHSHLVWMREEDALFVLSVGGGTATVSTAITAAVTICKKHGHRILGIVGRSDGCTAENGDCIIVVPTVEPNRITPHTEAFQAVIWHCLVSHPDLQVKATKW